MCAIPHLPLLTMGAITSGGTDKIAAAIRMAIFMLLFGDEEGRLSYIPAKEKEISILSIRDTLNHKSMVSLQKEEKGTSITFVDNP